MTTEARYDIRVESHEDDSVTLMVGSIEARITGASWKDANEAAFLLGSFLSGRAEVRKILTRTKCLAQTVTELESLMRAAEHHMTILVESCAAQSESDERP